MILAEYVFVEYCVALLPHPLVPSQDIKNILMVYEEVSHVLSMTEEIEQCVSSKI